MMMPPGNAALFSDLRVMDEGLGFGAEVSALRFVPPKVFRLVCAGFMFVADDALLLSQRVEGAGGDVDWAAPVPATDSDQHRRRRPICGEA